MFFIFFEVFFLSVFFYSAICNGLHLHGNRNRRSCMLKVARIENRSECSHHLPRRERELVKDELGILDTEDLILYSNTPTAGCEI